MKQAGQTKFYFSHFLDTELASVNEISMTRL